MELAPIAFLAGVISITSPCSLPLIPSYLSYISGVTAGTAGAKGRALAASALFVLGFGVIFTALGAGASLAGAMLQRVMPVALKAAGVFVVLMGLSMLGLLRLSFLHKELRANLSQMRSGPAGAFPLGMAFALGWTPCIGPILAAILSAAAVTQTAAKGAGLLAIYSLGMGIPFIGMAAAFNRAGAKVSWIRRHAHKIERLGGVLLVATGVLLLTGYWTRLFVPLMRLFSRTGWPPI